MIFCLGTLVRRYAFVLHLPSSARSTVSATGGRLIGWRDLPSGRLLFRCLECHRLGTPTDGTLLSGNRILLASTHGNHQQQRRRKKHLILMGCVLTLH